MRHCHHPSPCPQGYASFRISYLQPTQANIFTHTCRRLTASIFRSGTLVAQRDLVLPEVNIAATKRQSEAEPYIIHPIDHDAGALFYQCRARLPFNDLEWDCSQHTSAQSPCPRLIALRSRKPGLLVSPLAISNRQLDHKPNNSIKRLHHQRPHRSTIASHYCGSRFLVSSAPIGRTEFACAAQHPEFDCCASCSCNRSPADSV